MSIKAIIFSNGISKTIYANKFYFENSYKYTFFCPCCNCEMNIQSRTISKDKKTYFFFSKKHDKKNCTLYKEGHGKSIIHEGTPTLNFGMFSDYTPQKSNASLEKEATNNSSIPNENNNFVINFKKQNPRLNNIEDCIDWIKNCSIEEETINVGTKNKPFYKLISQILFRTDNFENYHFKNLSGIGILWGGLRCSPSNLGLSISKKVIAVREPIDKSKSNKKIKPIIFLLEFPSFETKRDFSDKYYNFDSNSTDLIVVGNWEKQPCQNGYQIYKSKIGKKCYTFIDYKKNDDEISEILTQD